MSRLRFEGFRVVRRIAITVTLLHVANSPSLAASLHVANHSFEVPVLSDGAAVSEPSIASQGTHGWVWQNPGPFFSDTGVWNPPESYYPGAGGHGTPAGADGSQVAYLQPTDSTIGRMQQGLAGPDGVFGNADDPRLLPNMIYKLTVSIGRRASVVGDDTGFAGLEMAFIFNPTDDFGGELIVGRAGTADFVPDRAFVDTSLTLDTSLFNLGTRIGGRFGIRLGSDRGGDVAVDYDNVRVDAIPTPEPQALAILSAGAGILIARRSALASARRARK